jgi:hypothetical protein
MDKDKEKLKDRIAALETLIGNILYYWKTDIFCQKNSYKIHNDKTQCVCPSCVIEVLNNKI